MPGIPGTHTHYELREYQQRSVDMTWGYLCNRPGNPVIVAPTGAGKSLIIADLFRGAYEHGRRVAILAHRKELIAQNADKIRSLVPDANVSIYSAGLGKKQTDGDVVLAGIQSVYNKALELDTIDLVLIDEAHMIPSGKTGDGMYRQFFDDLSISSPHFRAVGLTATPYRMKSGMIYGPGELFDGVSFNIPVAELIKDGYLCPITSQPVTQVSTDGLTIRGGEFVLSEMQERFDMHTVAACEEMVNVCNQSGREHVIVFCAGVEHAEHVRECIELLTGDQVSIITGETLPIMRETAIDQFRDGTRRWLVNVDVLTTGFDAPCVDCVAVLRATESPGLFCQIVGRGLRLHHAKDYCLLLDFGGNLQRHGPIDDPQYGVRTKSGAKTMAGAPVKQCPECEEMIPAGMRVCNCGFEFPQQEANHEPEADTESAVLVEQIKPKAWVVKDWDCAVHKKRSWQDGDPRTMRVNYYCVPEGEEDDGNLARETISEWVCLEHEGFAARKATEWWYARSTTQRPDNVDQAVAMYWAGAIADTTRIVTIADGKFTRVTGHTIGRRPEGEFNVKWHEEEEAPF